MATNKAGGVQGEGDYVSAKKFDDEERSFVESGRVAKKAREAADALDGPEGAELERARKASAQGKSLPKGRRRSPRARQGRERRPYRAQSGQGAGRNVSGQRSGLDLARRRLAREPLHRRRAPSKARRTAAGAGRP